MDASQSLWYPDKDDAQALSWSSAPSEHSLPYGSEYSSPHLHRPSYVPSVAPHGAYLPSYSFQDPGPSCTMSNFGPLSLSDSSSPSFQVDLRALQSTSGSRVSPESYSHANHLPKPTFHHNYQVDYQPPALQHPTGLDEYPRIAIRSGHPSPSHATQRSSLYNCGPLPDARTQASPDLRPNNPPSLVSRQLPWREFQSEQDVPQYSTVQRSITGLFQDHGSRPRPTDSALPRPTLDSQSTSLGVTSAHPLSTVNQGILQGAHNFTMRNVVMNDYSNSETFMLMLLAETIQGAAFDSARRYPPPRCLQGTRQATIDRTWSFISNHNGPKKIRCIIGPAGAGKSAVMQTLAEVAIDKGILGASIFFADGCNDVSKAITTLAYQFAVNYEPYRPFVRGALMHDPGLPRQSLDVQFRKLIVEPFVHRIPKATGSCLLVLLDGLDRCDDEDTVCELLRLVSEFSIDYPTSPLTWVISCRAEPHIMMFLGGVKGTYEEEVLEVGEEDACRDVKHFLRYQLDAIKKRSLTLRRCTQWPEDCDITKIAEASKGFFAYADSVVKFVKDAKNRNPRSRLSEVLEFIDGSLISQVDHQSHPMSTLDALYGKIMARIPNDVRVDAQRLLLQMMQRSDDLHFMCNWLCMTEDTAYDATYPLHSVLRIPEPEDASSLGLQCFHPSFLDYLRDYRRSKMFLDVQLSTCQLDATCIRRLLSQVINGPLKSNGPTLLNVPLSWPERRPRRVGNISKNEEVKVKILQRAAETTVLHLVENAFEFQDAFYIRALIAFDNDHLENDPDAFRRLLFADSRRPELIKLGVLKKMPLRMLDPADIDPRWLITCRFKCCATARAQKPGRCGSSCPADWEECVEDGYVNRTANFFFNICTCSDRFIRQLEIRRAQFPERLITIFLNLKRSGWVEYRFTDPDNCGSEWTYYFCYDFPSPTYPFGAGLLRYRPFQFGMQSSGAFCCAATPATTKSTASAYRSVIRTKSASRSSMNSKKQECYHIKPASDYRLEMGPPYRNSATGSGMVPHDSQAQNDFMSLLFKETIRTRSHRSSGPCHHGTRSAIISRIICFITDTKVTKRLCCVIGAAGVGKTAIMRTIEESPLSNITVRVPVFFPGAYTNGAKTITTIAYELAFHHEPYRRFIKDELILDPSLLQKSLRTQFNRLIVEPFIHRLPHSLEDNRFLILIDGLDQSDHEETLCELLVLTSDFCIKYPVSPLVWVISSRPEPHVITILDDVEDAYEKEEIEVDGSKAREDVQCFLRDELDRVAKGSLGADSSQWLSECDLVKIAGASQGFFAHAASVVKFIKSPERGSLDSRLQQVLEFIDSDRDQLENQTMALLNTLYSQITDKIPNDIVKDTWPWLLRMIGCSDDLHFMCNWLGVTEEAVYSVTDFLHSVLRIPEPGQANSRGLECVHPSFIDYIRSCQLRNRGPDIRDSTTQLDSLCVRRILEEAPNGTLKDASGTVANIRLSWPGDFDGDSSLVPGDEELKFRMYKAAAKTTVSRMAGNEPVFEGPFYIRALTTFENECFEDELHVFSRLLFDESRRSKFMEYGALREMSLKMISVTGIDERWPIRCQFKSSVSEAPHPCSPFCQVAWIKNNEKGLVCWTSVNLISGRCDCSERLVCRLEYEKAHCPDRLIRVFINLHRTGFVEYQFAEDGESEWIYNIPYSFLLTG